MARGRKKEEFKKSIDKFNEFFLITFNAKNSSDKSDPQYVPIKHNGNLSTFRRGIPQPVHAGHMDILSHAERPVYEEPDEDSPETFGNDRKIVDAEPRFPFQNHGKITKEAYLAARKILLDRKGAITRDEMVLLLKPDFESFEPVEKEDEAATGS